MDKQFLINAINGLVEANRLWNEMGDHIFALGGELWETKYTEAYYFHEELVFDLILKYRGHGPFDNNEFDAFRDTISDLSRNTTTKIKVITDEEPGYEIIYISNAEELLNSFLGDTYLKEIPF